MEEYIITVQNNSNSSSHIDVLKEELEEMCKVGVKAEAISQNIWVSLDPPTKIINGKTLSVYKAKKKLKECLSIYEKTI